MRDYVKRIERLEGAAAPIGQIGTIRIFLVAPGVEGQEPCAATCDGVTVRRTGGESKDDFMARVGEAFPEIPGKIRQVLIDQSRPPFGG